MEIYVLEMLEPLLGSNKILVTVDVVRDAQMGTCKCNKIYRTGTNIWIYVLSSSSSFGCGAGDHKFSPCMTIFGKRGYLLFFEEHVGEDKCILLIGPYTYICTIADNASSLQGVT